MERDLFGKVYFLQAEPDGLVKIGWTRSHPAERLRVLQTGSPVRLKLLGAIFATQELEGDLHRLFRASRSHGEWFRPDAPLLKFIAENVSVPAKDPRPRLSRVGTVSCPVLKSAEELPDFASNCDFCDEGLESEDRAYAYKSRRGIEYYACMRCAVGDRGDGPIRYNMNVM